jgi:pimeloyl-ACP methyl ester carboxylesterase
MNVDLHGLAAYAYTGGRPLDPNLPGVVLVHGAMNDHSVWALQSRYLAHHGRAVLAVDLPAHGRSGGEPLGVEQAGRWIAGLVEASGLRRTALVGHSMGSLIALEAASRLGERASTLVMVGTAYPMKVSANLLELCQRDALAAIDLVTALSNSTHAAKPSNPGPGSWNRGGSRALMRRMQRGYAAGNLFHAAFAACNAYGGGEAAADQVRCPVTLVLAERDQMTPTQAAAPLIAALKPRVVTLSVGHNLMGEAPDGVLNAINEALSQEPPR